MDEIKKQIVNRVHELYWKDDINCARTTLICLGLRQSKVKPFYQQLAYMEQEGTERNVAWLKAPSCSWEFTYIKSGRRKIKLFPPAVVLRKTSRKNLDH